MTIDYTDPNIFYFVGNSNPPENTSVKQTYGNIAIGALIDIRTSEILDANITLVSQLAFEFVRAQLIGKNILTDMEEIIRNMERYQGPALKSIIVALKALHNKYTNFKQSSDV